MRTMKKKNHVWQMRIIMFLFLLCVIFVAAGVLLSSPGYACIGGIFGLIGLFVIIEIKSRS